jgi:chromosome segregation ATPase
MNTKNISFLIALTAFSILARVSLGYAEQNTSFYDEGLNEDVGIWRLRQKKLTDEEKKELDKYVEKMSEARLKEQKAQGNLADAERRLNEFLNNKEEEINKEELKLKEKIDRAKRKAERAQEELDKEMRALEALEESFDDDLAKEKALIDKKQEKLEEQIKKNQEKLESVQEKKKDISQAISEFEKAIEKKFK